MGTDVSGPGRGEPASDGAWPPASGRSESAVSETLVDGELVVGHGPGLGRGSVVGRYVILEELGRGGMGEVFAAYDPELDRKLAVKILKRDRSDSVRSQARMMREAQALAKLSHANVVAIHDVGTHDDRVFVAMEFVAGNTVREWLKSQRRPWPEIVRVFVQAGRGLAAAHAKGLVHRDFKPENVMVGLDGVVRVLDFGLAHRKQGERPLGGTAEPDPSHDELDSTSSSTLDSPLTRAGAILGTPAYMSPEQHLGQPTDASTDQFSFCIALYEAVYGEAPFAGETQAARAYAVSLGEVRAAPRGVSVPGWLRRALLRGLAVKPADRHPSMEALLAQLESAPSARRRNAVLALGLVAVTGLLVGLDLAGDAEQAPCRAAAARLAGLWDDDARRAVRVAFDAVGRPYAGDTYEATERVLDQWAVAWSAMHVEACEATRVRGEQSEEAFDLRMRCLERRRADLAALVDVLRSADDAVVENAVNAAVSLPSVDACADVVALRARQPPPSDAVTLEQLDRVEDEVASARALTEAGRYTLAVETATRAAEAARVLAYRPVEAAALGALGRALEAEGHLHEAERALLDAALAAEVSGDDATLADVRLALALVAGDGLERPREGHLWITLARASIERLGGDPRREAVLENNLGHIYDIEGKYDEELEHKLRALEILEHADAPALARAGIHNAVAGTLAQLGRPGEAMQHAQRGLEIARAELGDEHPQVGIQQAGMALVHDYAGRYDQSLPLYRESLAVLERGLGAQHPKLAEVVNNYAIAQIEHGDYAGGEASFRRALEIRRVTLGPDHPGVAQGLGNLGGVLRMQGRVEEALEVLTRALEIRRTQLAPEHPDIGGSLAALANVYEDLGQFERAIEARTQALAILEKVHGSDSPQLLVDLGNLAYGHARLKRRAPAVAAAERALEILSRHDEVAVDVAAFVHVSMARASTAGGRADRATRERARAHARTARALLGDAPAPWERKLLAELAAEQGWPD